MVGPVQHNPCLHLLSPHFSPYQALSVVTTFQGFLKSSRVRIFLNHANLMIATFTHFHSLSSPIPSFTHIGDETGIRGCQTRAQLHGDFRDNLGVLKNIFDLISYCETEIWRTLPPPQLIAHPPHLCWASSLL